MVLTAAITRRGRPELAHSALRPWAAGGGATRQMARSGKGPPVVIAMGDPVSGNRPAARGHWPGRLAWIPTADSPTKDFP
jgi:hypothetical protein